MRWVSVVPAQVAVQGAGAMAARRVGEAVGPFAQQCLDERLGLAVGLWPSWSDVASLDLERVARVTPGKGAVAVSVVGEDAFDRDPLLGVPGDGATEEGNAVARAVAWQ